MAFFNWSKTAATNATADATVNWAEGMAPSAVNDSARAMMARTAEWRDDVSGTITTGGTSTAYTVTSNQVFDTLAHMNNAMIAFVMHTTNGATVTLNVDGLGAKPLRSAPAVELPSGVLVQGTPYVATYNNSDGAFYLQGFTVNPYVIPIGGFLDYAGTTAPNSSFVLPAGQAISRTTYATLFALVSTTFGTGDGSTTFNVPDLRGRVAAGLDNLNGSAANRIGSVSTDNGTIVGATLGSTGGSSTHALALSETPSFSYTPAGTVTVTLNTVPPDGGGVNEPNTGGTISVVIRSGNASATGSFSGTPATLGGSNGAHAMLQPSMMLGKIFRVI